MPAQARLRALVVDDNETHNDLVALWLRNIQAPSFEPVLVDNCAAAYRALADQSFDVAILDRVLGDGTGMEILQRIRGRGETKDLPVVFLSGLDKEREVILGLERGADEYLAKPCTEELFRARLLALLRRNRRGGAALVSGPGFELDPADGRLLVDGRSEHLEPKEIEILLLLLRRPNVIHSAETLHSAVWGKARTPRNTLESRLSSLRRKLGAQAGCIENVRGSGYRLLT